MVSRQNDRMVDVFVIAGAAGSGKTTFGRALAKRLAIPLLDLDEVTAPLVAAFRAAHPELDEAEALLDPNIGALTQIVNEYQPAGTSVIVKDVVRDIDAIVKQVSYSGWNDSQPGDKAVRTEIRKILKRYALPLTGPLFDHCYAYIRENY